MTAINEVADLTLENGVAVITLDSPPVNAMSPTLLNGLYDGLIAALDDPAAKAIVLICAGRTFIAGADLKSLGKEEPKVDFFELQSRIENAAKPTIAAMHGTALGGGLETALTFHYRIAVPSAKMGLPEVKLGLLPGGGGTQRLTRIVGAKTALDMLITGRQINANEACEMGLVDRLAREGELRPDAIAYAAELIAANTRPKRIRDLDHMVEADRKAQGLFEEYRSQNAKLLTGLDAPQAILRCVEAAVAKSFDEGLGVEREEFQKVLKGPQSAALRHVFGAERAAQKVPGLDPKLATLPVNKVGILGAGLMGTGIATAFLEAGVPVAIVENTQAALDRGIATITSTFSSKVSRGKLAQEKADQMIGMLTPTLKIEAFADADLVIEAVYEDLDIKKDVLAKLDKIIRKDAILATNTSFLDVNELAAVTSDPARVIGLHFFSPANVMRLLEIVRGAKTSDQVLVTALQLAKKLGKAPVVSGVCFGFIGNRILWVRQEQADALVLEGVLPWDVDRVMTDFGFSMGPFALFDLIGLDLGWSPETSKSATVRERMCEAGRKGQKSKAGYYDYDDKRRATPSPAGLEIIKGLAKVEPGSAKVSDETILKRLLYPMINEGLKILEEGIALRASDIDHVWVTGYGWPAVHGGPMFYGETIGWAVILEGLAAIPNVTPAALLNNLVAEKKTLAA